MPRSRAAALFYAVAVVLTGSSVFVLLQLLQRFETDMEARITGLQRVFADPAIMKTSRDPYIRFAEIEGLAAKFQNEDGITTITVSKMFGERERVVFPFYLESLRQVAQADKTGYPLPWALVAGIRKLPLRAGSEVLGFLYVRVDDSAVRNVRLVIGSLFVLLIGAVTLFLVQFRRQEQVISMTTVELEQKRRELVRLERLALAGQLSANVFHDLKKPVLNIKNEMEELGDTGGLSANAIARRIRDQVDLFFGILREGNLERFVRAQGDREYVDINEMVERSLALVRYERGSVEVVKHLDPELVPVFAEPVRLVQVFSNLVLNAFQAMDGRGTLTISSRGNDAEVVVTISDTGPGIPADSMERIFLPFYTTKPTDLGTGLGLYISRDIIRDLGGQILVSSSASGTSFTVALPLKS